MLILLLIIVSVEANAYKVIEEILEPAILEVRYERTKVLDTLNMDNDFRKDLLTLKIGKTASAFYSAELKTIDSIEYRDSSVALAWLRDKEHNKRAARLPRETVFRNYPKGKTRNHDRFDLCGWKFDENLEKPAWNVTPSVRNIMGYDCILAVAEFRGRKWEAWFTPEIPVSEGPWKLWGLPGLILEARDSRGHYSYKAVSLHKKNIGNVEYFDYRAGSRMTTSREKALPRKWKAIHEDLRYIILTSGMYGMNRKDVKKRDHIPHTNYDFEETDYPHK